MELSHKAEFLPVTSSSFSKIKFDCKNLFYIADLMYKLSLIWECVFLVIILKRKSEDNFGNSSGGDKRTRKSEIKISKRTKQ